MLHINFVNYFYFRIYLHCLCIAQCKFTGHFSFTDNDFMKYKNIGEWKDVFKLKYISKTLFAIIFSKSFQGIIGALGKVYQANSLQQIGQDAVWDSGLKNWTRISSALTTTWG